jgi:uncharacterized paraquat-inducible protein A
MYLCDNYREENKCAQEIINARNVNEIKPGEKIPIWPYGEQQEKLDHICEKCEHAHFEINELECPVCRSNLVEQRRISEMSYGPVKPSHIVYFYKCSECRKPLFSYTRLL